MDRSVRHRSSCSFLALSFLLLLWCSVAYAQSVVDTAAISPFSRLTVRPRTMRLGKATTKAGVQQLDSLPGYLLYVPKSCVGTRRVPLVVFLHGGGGTGQAVVDEQREIADKYGMIVLAPTAAVDGWDVLYHAENTGATASDDVARPLISRNVIAEFRDVKNINRALAYVLQHFAIDPDKIAIGGFSDGGTYALFLGRNNENVFSQVMAMSPFDRFDGSLGARNTKTRFLIASGTNEPPSNYALSLAHEIRAEGHDVTTILSERGHVFTMDERNYAWSWLSHGWGWKSPSAVKIPHLRAVPNNDSVLTNDALQKMIAFWGAVALEPDSIRTNAVKTYRTYGTMMVGHEQVIVATTDIAAIVAAYPAIATDLASARLTVQQEEAYRMALLRTHFLSTTGNETDDPAALQNLAFEESHRDALAILRDTGIWAHEDVKHRMTH